MKAAPPSHLIVNSQVAQALTAIGDRWGFLIIRDVYQGVRRFEELRRMTGAVRGTLASRLKSLVANGILYKNSYSDSPVRYEYRLTDKGLDLYPVVLTIWSWETRWASGEHIPPKLVHKSCGHTMQPLFRCRCCHLCIDIHDVTYTAGEGAALAEKVPPRFQRRFKARATTKDVDQRFFHYLDIIGDRWTALVVAAAFFGLQRYDEFLGGIGIATNILSDRLRLLVDMGVLERRRYQDNPIRYEYHLSVKGKDIYASTVALHEWANRWLIGRGEQPLKLKHTPCKKPLESELVCSECDQALIPANVAYESDVPVASPPQTGSASIN